jgi:hypothetical protein
LVAKSYVRSENEYFKAGLNYPWRTSSGFAPRILPSGCVFAAQGSAILPKENDENWSYTSLLALGCLNSNLYQLFISIGVGAIEGAARSYQVGQVQRLPWPDTLNTRSFQTAELVRLARQGYYERRIVDTQDETARSFICVPSSVENACPLPDPSSVIYQIDKILENLLYQFKEKTLNQLAHRECYKTKTVYQQPKPHLITPSK